MKKGASTLTRILELWSQKDLEAELYRRLGWDAIPASAVITCIVSCNGMFPGLAISGHPIRRWAELRNTIESGILRVGSIQFVEDEGGLNIQTDDLVNPNMCGASKLPPPFP